MKVKGKVWKFGDNIPTDLITPITILFMDYSEMAKHVLERINPEFPRKVKRGDILVAGKNFACSSGRTTAPKALKATGIGCIIAESFSRTFYRNAHECGLPLLICKEVTSKVNDGDELEVDIEKGLIENLSTGETIKADPPKGFLLRMIQFGGLIPYLESGKFEEIELEGERG